MFEDEKFHYRIMKRAIYLDRMRRKEILAGNIKDIEYFRHLDLVKKDNNHIIISDMLNQLYKDYTFLELKQKTNNLNLNFYENAFVCLRCFQVYQFLSQVYTKQEDFYLENKNNEKVYKEPKERIFYGMNRELNENILKIVSENIDKAQAEKNTDKKMLCLSTNRSKLVRNTVKNLEYTNLYLYELKKKKSSLSITHSRYL